MGNPGILRDDYVRVSRQQGALQINALEAADWFVGKLINSKATGRIEKSELSTHSRSVQI